MFRSNPSLVFMMMTAPGRQEMLSASIRSLGIQPIVICDQVADPTLNHARALEVGSRLAEWVVVLEDDVRAIGGFCQAVNAWLLEHAREDRRLYAFYNARPEICEARGEWDCPIGWFFGTQCYAIRSADGVSLVGHLRGPANKMPRSQYDLAIAIWHIETYPAIPAVLCSAPSFVQHIGRTSSINSPFHESPSFDPTYRYQPRSAAA